MAEPPDTREAVAPLEIALETDPYVLQPGEEAYLCQSFGDPFGGGSRFARAFESRLGPGGHHLLLFYTPHVTAPGRLEKCASFEFAPTAYGAQKEEEGFAFPPGVAVEIPERDGLRVQVHYLNVTQEPVTVRSSVRIQIAEPEEVEHHAGGFFLNPKEILIRAHSRETVTQSCRLPFDVNVVATMAHMHKFGTAFESSLAGRPLMKTTLESGTSSTLSFTPPRIGPKGTEVSVTCHYENPETFDVRGGAAFETEEMCILSAYYYPLPPGLPGTVDACNPASTVVPMEMSRDTAGP